MSPNTWYEVDLTSHITADGTYSLRVSDSVGGADYSSKEGTNDPELVLTLDGTPVATNTPTNTPTPGPSPTPTNTPTATHTPSATATTPPPVPFNSAAFVYDGDGRRVKGIFNGTTTTFFVGAHYEVTGSTIIKYYYAGSQRIAMRTNGTLNYLLSDHLGSTSLTTNASGQIVSELRYKAWGETRYASGNSSTKYQYAGQFSYESDFGSMFYNARWYDSYLNHFTQPDTIVPDPSNSQDWDRYAYVRNNPIYYTDSTGHLSRDVIKKMLGVETWDEAVAMFNEGGQLGGEYGLLELLRQAEIGDTIYGIEGRPHLTGGEEIEIGTVVAGGDTTAYNLDSDGNFLSISDFANYLAYGYKNDGEMVTFGNSHYYEHIEFDDDMSLVTLGTDAVGVVGSFLGLGWIKNSPKLVQTGNAVSRAASVNGVASSLLGSDEPDWTGGLISAGGLVPGPVGAGYSILGTLIDAIYIGR